MNLVDKYKEIENGKVKPNQFYFRIRLNEEWEPGDTTSYPLEVIIVKESYWLEHQCIELCDLTVKYPELIKILKELKLEKYMRSTFVYTGYNSSMNQKEIADEMNKRMIKKGFRSVYELSYWLE